MRKTASNGLAAEVGFVRQGDGALTMIAESMERGTFRVSNYEQYRTKKQLAGVHADLQLAASMGLIAERIDDDTTGEIYVDVYTQDN